MKERPIIFSEPMVRALLDGSKTQTRRVVKPQPAKNHPHDGGTKWVHNLHLNGLHVPVGSVGHLSVKDKTGIACPFGQPLDQLWVREAWRATKVADELKPSQLSGGSCSPIWYEAQNLVPFHPSGFGKLRPSIFMPRWASRITLEITRVQVERLQDISQADAIAEGAPPSHPSIDRVSREFGYADFSRSWYAQIWESGNGPDSWDANPWVWVIEFKVLKGNSA